jgi:hypothetical protein
LGLDNFGPNNFVVTTYDVAAAMASPLTVTLKKNLGLIFISISSLSILGQSLPRNRQVNSQRSALAYFAQPPIETDVSSKN